MKVAVQKPDGSLAFEELPDFNTLREDIAVVSDNVEKIVKEINSLKIGFQLLQTTQKKPSFVENEHPSFEDVIQKAIEQTENERPHIGGVRYFNTRKQKLILTPNDVSGRVKNVYQSVLEGTNTSKAISEKMGVNQTLAAAALTNLYKYGFVERSKPEGHEFVYRKGLDTRIERNIIKKNPRKTAEKAKEDKIARKRHGASGVPKIHSPSELKGNPRLLYDAVLEGNNTFTKLAEKFPELKRKQEISNALTQLFKRGFLTRTGTEKRFVYAKGLDYRTQTFTVQPTRKEETKKGNPFEESVRGYADGLKIYLTPSAVTELAKHSDWAVILQHAKHEGCSYFSASSIKYFKQQLYAADKPKTEETPVQENYQAKHKWLPPSSVQNLFANGGSEEIVEFIRGFEEKREITTKDFINFLHGMETKDALGVWYNWFAPQASRWLVKEALGYPVTVRAEVSENKITWTG